MSYNRKAIVDALSKMNKAKKPKQVNDIIMDPEGQNKFPGLPTRIPSNNITMETTPYPVLGVDNFGNEQMMYPGANYIFPGAEYVDEYPMMQKGGQRPTLYVDPNDPAGRARYQAHQDSLASYNFTQAKLDNIKKTNKTPSGAVLKLDSKSRISREEGIKKTYDEYKDLAKKYGIPWTLKDAENEWHKYDDKIKNTGAFMYKTTDGGNYTLFDYKKPTQPVQYKPNPEIVAKQQQLIDAGFDIGKADGIWGPKSQTAWEEFQKTQATEPEAIPTPEQAPTLEVAPLDNTPQRPVQTQTPPQQPVQTNMPQTTPAPQMPSGYNVWTNHLGQPLDPQIYGYAPSNNPRQISQHADTYALKRANEAYNKLGAIPWATTGNKLVTDLYKPYFSKQAATNAIEQTAQQLGVETSQLQIVKAPAGYSGYVIIQTLPQQKYGGIFQSGGATDWKSRIASTLNYQKGGQLSKEEFEKRKAAYKKMTGRDFEPPKSFKQSPQAREYYQNKYNQQPVIQSQPSETVRQSRGMSADEAEQLKIQNAPLDPRINQFSFEADNRSEEQRQRDQEAASQLTDPTGWNQVANYLQAPLFQAGNFWDYISGGDDWEKAQQAYNLNQLNPYSQNKMFNFLNTGLSNTGNALMTGMEIADGYAIARAIPGIQSQVGRYLSKPSISNTPRQLPSSPNVISSVDDIVMYRTQKPGQTEEILELMDLQKKANDIGIQNLSLPERVKLAEFQSRPNVGQAFDTDLTKINYYGNPNIRRTRGYTETPEVLRITVPRKQAELYNVKNFPEYAKQSTKRTEYILPMSIIQKAEKFSFDDLAKLQGALPGFGRQNVSTKLLQKEGIDFNLPIKPLNSPKSYESFYTPWSNPNIKDLNKILDEIKDANTWQKEWYNHPHRTSILDKAERTFQREIEAGNKSLISEYKGENPFTKMKKRIERENYKAIGVSSKSPLVEDLFLNKQTLPGTTPFGVSGYRPKMGGERQNIVFVDVASPTRARSTAVHEGNHGLTDANTLIPKYYQEDMVKIFGKNTQVPLRTEKGFASYDDYLKNPTEIYARVAEMRQVFKIKPERVISEEDAVKMLNHIKAKKTPLPPEFAKAIKDPKKLAQVMNYLPAIGVVIGAASQYQEGGTTEEELTPAQLAMMKARLAYAHMHSNPSAQRMVAPVDNPYIFTGNEPYASPDTAGYSGTHYMFSQGPFAVPTIQTGPDGQLYYNVNASPNDSEAMQFDSPEDAEVFARYYKTVAPAFQDMELTDEEIEEYKRGGCTIVKL
jgi:hypothetical protein